MPSTSSERHLLRFLLGGALLSGVVVLAGSCVEALDLSGRRDANAEACEVIDRCFGDAYRDCAVRVTGAGEGPGGQGLDTWLETVPRCIEGCGDVHECLDFPGMCEDLHADCTVDADCCGYTSGTAKCAGGACCVPLGSGCGSDGDCCDGLPCSLETFTCGGTFCGNPGETCLNDFQCCTGRCSGPVGAKQCDNIPCPPVGFACDTNEECCELVCRNGKCADPDECALITETCTADRPCCDPALECPIAEGSLEGICTDNSTGCFPNNSDCFSDAQCCGGYCVPEFKLCGECQEVGGACSVAAPCCAPYVCDTFGTCSEPPMP